MIIDVRSLRQYKSTIPNKEKLTHTLFTEFNAKIFENKLPEDMQISWSVRLNKTAGRTHTQW